MPGSKRASSKNQKGADLDVFTINATDKAMTTHQRLKINDDHNSLKGGERGGTLLENFVLREKITHFDHERTSERFVLTKAVVRAILFPTEKKPDL